MKCGFLTRYSIIKNFQLLFFYINGRKLMTKMKKIWKNLTSLLSALTNCFVNLSLICRGGNVICLLELEGYQSHFYHQASILFSTVSFLLHDVGPLLYYRISRENMESLCIQIVDPEENLPFSNPHIWTNYGLSIWSVVWLLVLLAHTFLLKLLNAQQVPLNLMRRSNNHHNDSVVHARS